MSRKLEKAFVLIEKGVKQMNTEQIIRLNFVIANELIERARGE